MKKNLSLIAFLLFVISVNAQSTVLWDGGATATPSASPTSGVPANITVSDISQGNNNGTTPLLSATSVSNNSGASGANNFGASARIGSLSTATNGSAYFTFTVSIAPGKTTTITQLAFGTRSTSTGPSAYSVRTSGDNYATDIATGSITISSPAAWIGTSSGSFIVNLPPGGSVTFRIYGHSGTGSASASTANWRIDDIKLSISAVLSVEFTKIDAKTTDSKNRLIWQTASEKNSAYFDIQRSTNAVDFQSIGTVKGNGTTNNMSNYTFEDKTPSVGTNYYRLQQVDADGTTTLSKVVSVQFNGKKEALKVYPTLATDKLIVLNADETTPYNIVNLYGQSVQTGQLNEQNELNINNLLSGTYILKIGNSSIKFFKN
jgi:Secretion system C-terminal sorting domain